ncbi:MAG TPA: proton-conducting transporter membrane subunit, partial [Flavobacteriales bacterium]|nr:proton-conducting transporter membrane subunit [Flavobacteriales bacterium]
GHIKITYITFLVGTAAIAGLPLLSGFFSKDLILAFAFQRSPVIFGLLLFGALLTTFYMFRLLFLVFYGTYRGKAHPHESPLTMTIPLMVLAVLSVLGGLLNLPHLFGGHEPMKHFLETAAAGIGYEHLELSALTEIILMGITTTLVGIVIYVAYGRFVKTTTLEGEEAAMPVFKRLIAQRWRIDELYRALFEKPYSWLSMNLFAVAEKKVMIPLMNGVGDAAIRVGDVVRRVQTGNASFHLLAMLCGLILFLVITLMSN